MIACQAITGQQRISRFISEVVNSYAHGFVDYQLRIYPGSESRSKVRRVMCCSDELIPRRWFSDEPNADGIWEILIHRIRPGTGLCIHMILLHGGQAEIVPLGESDVVNGVIRVPDYRPEWLDQASAAQPPSPPQAAAAKQSILLEHTLEGLLADYEEGTFFTNSIEELLDWSIAQRILHTQIPETIAGYGYTEIMAPLFASVADRCHLDPKFNYLIYNLSPDWQLGSTAELRQLVQRFRRCGIELIPDLVFVHQVADPYAGSRDDVQHRDPDMDIYKHASPYRFRDYGTWYFDLQDPVIRRTIIDKVILTVLLLDLRWIRIDYVDGLLLQYRDEPINYGRILLQELKQVKDQRCPSLRIIAETFEMAGDASISDLVDSVYAPRGFALLEELLAPHRQPEVMLHTCMQKLRVLIEDSNHQSARESSYSQLHDECWFDDVIARARPFTPWAYGRMPCGLALARVDQMIAMEWIPAQQRQQLAVALFLLLRSLGLVMAFNRWMETVGCLSLDQGRLDEADHWRLPWNAASPWSKQQFQAMDMDEQQRRQLLDRARAAVCAANHSMARVGASEANPLGPPLRLIYANPNSGVLALVRWGKASARAALLLANLSPWPVRLAADEAITLQDLGCSQSEMPLQISALHLPLQGNDEPLRLLRAPGTGPHFQFNRDLQGYESAWMEVTLNG